MNAGGLSRRSRQLSQSSNKLGVAYYLGGSVVSSTYGIPRATFDVDLVADLHVEHVRPFIQQLEDEYYVDADMIRDAIRHRSSFNLIYLDSMLKVDVFLPKARSFMKQKPGCRISHYGER